MEIPHRLRALAAEVQVADHGHDQYGETKLGTCSVAGASLKIQYWSPAGLSMLVETSCGGRGVVDRSWRHW